MDATYRLEDLLVQAQNSHADAARRRRRSHAEVERILDTATRSGRRNLDPAESRRVEALFRTRDQAVSDYDASADRIRRIEALAEEEREAQRTAAANHTTGAAPPVTRESRARIGYEARTYRQDEDPKGTGFLADVMAGYAFNDPAASARLAQHMAEERVERPQYLQRADTVTTANMVGVTVPQYLTDFYAPATAALQPLVDHANHHDLPPSGMSVNISRITTATTAAIQASELSAVSGTGADDTLLSVPVLSIAGENTVSRQALERGTGVEDIVLQDLFRRVASAFDNALINQATTGILAAGQTTAFTSASPTQQLLWPLIFQAQSLLEQALLGVAVPDYLVVHPRRWNWMTSALGSTWPLFGGSGVPAQSGGITMTNEYGAGVRGVLPNGLKVIVDGNLPVNLGAGTNQDPALVIASQEVNCWTDPLAPVYIRAEQPQAASLGVLMVLYQYCAYTVGRYSNNPGIINGTGMVAPAGF